MYTTEHWNWDTWTGEGQEDDYGEDEEDYDGERYDTSGPHCDDEDFIVSQLIFAKSFIFPPLRWSLLWCRNQPDNLC